MENHSEFHQTVWQATTYKPPNSKNEKGGGGVEGGEREHDRTKQEIKWERKEVEIYLTAYGWQH